MWAIAQTKPRQEYKAEKNLNNQGFRCYLPIIERKRYSNSSWIDHKEVFFSNYIFIDLSSINQNLAKINNTFGISRLLINKDLSRPHVIDDQYISFLRENINNKSFNINTLKEGSKVSITKGRLSEFTGIFLEKSSKSRSKVLISLLNNEYITTIDNSCLQRCF